MSSLTNQRTQTILSIMLSFVIASGLWYFVVGRDHIDTQIDLRVEYRGLPAGLTMLDGAVSQLSVSLRGSEELLKGLRSRGMTYTVDLSSVQKGANQFPVQLSEMPEFKDRGVEIIEVTPSRIVLQIDAVLERIVFLEQRILPLPKDSPYVVSRVSLTPSSVTVKGAESRIGSLEKLATVPHDPSKNASEGRHTEQIAVNAPAHVEVTPPVATLSYYITPKTVSVRRHLPVEIEGVEGDFEISPSEVDVVLNVPEKQSDNQEFTKDLHVLVRNAGNILPGASQYLPLTLVGLPEHAYIASTLPSIKVTRKTATVYNPAMLWNNAASAYSREDIPLLPNGNQTGSFFFQLPKLSLPLAAQPQEYPDAPLAIPGESKLKPAELPLLTPLPAAPHAALPQPAPPAATGSLRTNGE